MAAIDILLFICYIAATAQSAITPPSFDANRPISHIVKFNNTYFIGSTNFIYQVDASFKLMQSLRIGPVDNQDNVVTLLVVSPDMDKPVIFWCGSVHYGLCHVNQIHNLNAGDFLDRSYFPDKLRSYFDEHDIDTPDKRELVDYGVYGHLGSTAGTRATFVDITSNKNLSIANGQHIMLASITYDGRYNLSLPHLGYYTLAKTEHARNYYIKPTIIAPSFTSFSWLSMFNAIAHKYPIHRVSMIEHGDYVYVVAVQKMNLSHPLESVSFHTRVARFNKTDVLFRDYIEAEVSCRIIDSSYNIAVDATLGDASSDILEQFGADVSGKVLYLLQGKSSGSSPFPASNSRVVCALPLSAINAHFNKEMQRCHKGRGQLVEWYYGREKRCQSHSVVNVGTGKAKKEALYLLMKARTLTFSPIISVPYNASMLYVEVQQDTTVAAIGSNQGDIHKINLATGSVYHTFGGSGGSPVKADALADDGKLTITSGSKVMSVFLRTCNIYSSSETCTDSGDPMMCGWCGGTHCSTESQCNSSNWFYHASPPQIQSISPSNGSLTGSTILTITGNYFTLRNVNMNSTSTTVSLNNRPCRITSLQSNRMFCVTSASPVPWVGSVMVVRRDSVEGNGELIATSGQSSTQFAFLRPQVFKVSPNYGPVMGGTTLTIAGENLNVGNSCVVKVGNSPCVIKSLTQNILKCTTPAVTFDPRAVDIALLIDGMLQFLSGYHYRPNPVIQYNTHHTINSVLSGGVPICVKGTNLNSTSHASATFSFPTLGRRQLIQSCSITSDSEVCCLTPNLAEVVTLSMVANRDTINSNMVLTLESTSSAVATVVYHHQPTVYSITAVQLSNNIVQVDIEGKGFGYLNVDLISITQSKKNCLVEFSNPTSVRCSLHYPDIHIGDELHELSFEYGNLKLALNPVILKKSFAAPEPNTQLPSTSFNVTVMAAVGIAIIGISISALVIAVIRKTKVKSASLGVKDVETYAGLGVQETIAEGHTRQLSDLHHMVKERGALIDTCRLRLGGVLGSGCFGKVHKGVLYENPSDPDSGYEAVAVKTIKGCQNDTDEVKKFVDEALLMQTFKHRHVLTMIGISFSCDGQPRVVLPYMANGDLRSYLRNTNNRVSLDDMLTFANDIALGMDYLEHVLCVHRDLAARNCMLDSDLRVKVADFGLSRDLDTFENNLYQSTDRNAKLPVKWMSPESLVERCFSSKSDVWSFGITLWEIFSRGSHPYPEVDNLRISEHIQTGGRLRKPQACPQQIYGCMQSTWNIEPEERPSFTMIVNELQLFIANRDSSPSSPVGEGDAGED